MKKIVTLFVTLLMFAFNIHAQQSVSVSAGSVSVSSTILNPVIGTLPKLVPCVDLLNQEITVANNSGSAQDVIFTIDVINTGISLDNLIAVSSWFDNINHTTGSSQYEFTILNVLDGATVTSPVLEFKLDCDINTNSLGHNLIFQGSNALQNFNADPTVLIYQGSGATVFNALGEEVTFSSFAQLTSGGTEEIFFDFTEEPELDISTVNVTLTSAANTTITYTYLSTEFNQLNNQLYANISSLFSDGTWDFGDGNIAIDISFTISDCSNPAAQTFTEITVQNVCHSDICGDVSIVSYDAEAQAANRNFLAALNINTTDDICSTSGSGGEFDVRITNRDLIGTNFALGTGGKALTSFTLAVDFNVLSFDEMILVDQSNNTYPLMDFIGAGPSNSVADFIVDPLSAGQLSVSTHSGGGQNRMIFTFSFYDAITQTQDDLTGSHWENVFDDILYAGTVGELQNGMAEGDYFDLRFTNVQFVGGDNTKSCGGKTGGNSPGKYMSFFSLGKHAYLDMCSPLPKVDPFVNAANVNISILDNELAPNNDYHPNNKNIYWNNSLGMVGENYDNNGNPLVGVDLEQGAEVLLAFNLLEAPLEQPNHCEPNGTYGATEYNPWNFNHDIFGADTRDQIEYWAVVDLPNGLDLQSSGSISFDYTTLTGTTVSNPISYPVPTADIVELGMVGTRELIAIPLFITGVDIHNVVDITLPLALNCSSFSTSCAGPVATMPEGDVFLQIRAYRCPITPSSSQAVNLANFTNTLYLTTACGSFEFLIHCNGLCGSPIGASGEDTFRIERSSFGWTDDKMVDIAGFDEDGNFLNQPGNAIPGLTIDDIPIDRIYPYDKLRVEMTGHIATTYNPCGGNCSCQSNGDCCVIDVFPANGPTPVMEFLPSISWETGSVPNGIFDLSDDDVLVEIYPTSVDFNNLPLPAPAFSALVDAADAGFVLDPGNTEATQYNFEIDAATNAYLATYLQANPGSHRIRFVAGLKTNNVGVGSTAHQFVLLAQRFAMKVNGSPYESCDPWTSDLTYLHPEVKQLRNTVSESTHGCSDQVSLSQQLISVLGDDFPNEFRPWLQWPEDITFEVENGTFDGFSLSHPNNPTQGVPGYFSTEEGAVVYPDEVEQTTTPSGLKEITFKWENDINPIVPFYWDAIESGIQTLSFTVRRLCPQEPSIVHLKNHSGLMVESSPDFVVGPVADPMCSEPATYNEGTSSWGTQVPEIEPYITPISLSLLDPTTNSQSGISNPTCWEIELSNPKFIENVWMEIEDVNDYITGITITRINYGGITPQTGIVDQMYEDADGNWVSYLGTINKRVGHGTTAADWNTNSMRASSSTYQICFEYECEDVSNDLIQPTLRIGWDCSISNGEIYNQNYVNQLAVNLGSSDVNDVVNAISDIQASNLTLNNWMLNRSVCGTMSNDVSLTIDPKLSIITAANNDPDGAITMDPCNGITEGLDYTVSSIGEADISQISTIIQLPPGLVGIYLLEEIISLQTSIIDVCSDVNSQSLSDLLTAGDVVITENPSANSITITLHENIVLDGQLTDESNPCFEADFLINFHCITENYQNEQIIIFSEGVDVCGNALPVQFPLTVSFSNLFEDPTFSNVSIPTSTGNLDCTNNTIIFNVDIENSILPMILADGTYALSDMVANSLSIQSNSAAYSITAVDQNDLSNVIISVSYTGNVIPCNTLSSFFTFDVDFAKPCASECADIASTISGTFDLCPFMISVNNVTAESTTCGGCNGELSFDVVNGNPPYAYTLNAIGGSSYNGTVINSPTDLLGICSGDYTLTVTDDDNCEVEFNGILIESSMELAVTADVFQIACPGGKGSIENVVVSNGSGSYTYRWRNANGFVISLTSDLLNVAAGTYSLEIEDNNADCVTSVDYTILPYTGYAMDIYILAEAPYCFSDPMNEVISSFVYDASFDYSTGLPNYSYTWTSNNGNNALAQVDPMRFTLDNNTIYTVTVTDLTTGCTADAQITVEVGPCSAGCANPPCGGGTGSGSCTININGTIYEDADQNSNFSPGDNSLAAWNVDLKSYNISWGGTPLVPNSGLGLSTVAFAVSNNSGAYSFSNNFTWGVYLLDEVVPTGWDAILPPLGRQTIVIGGCQDITQADFLNELEPCQPLLPKAVFDDIEDAANNAIYINGSWCSNDYCFADGPLTTLGGTPDGPRPLCAPSNQPVRNNKWFAFNSSTGEIEVELYSDGVNGGLRSAYLTLWEWNDDGDDVMQNGELSELDCQRYINITGLSKLSVTAAGLDVGSQYYVSIDNNVSPGYAGEFSICVYDEASNDILEGAETLVMNTCSPTGTDHLSPFTTHNGSFTKHIAGLNVHEKPSCSPSNQPVRNNKWFEFQTSTGEVEVELHSDGLTGDLKGSYLTLWEWNDNANGILEDGELVELDCQRYINVTGSQKLSVTASGLSTLSSYYVTVDNNVSPGYAGEFSICVYDQASNDILEGAETLVMNTCSPTGTDHLSPFTTHNGSFTKHIAGLDVHEKPSCSPSNQPVRNNKWFEFQTSTGEVEVELHSDGLTGDLKGSYLTLWEWNDNANGILEDGELVELDCQRYINVTGSQKLSVTASGLSTLSSYYVTVDNNVSPGYAGEFSICVYDQASNDILEGAETLVMNTCSPTGTDHLSPFTTHNGSFTKHIAGLDVHEKPSCSPSNQPVRNNKWFEFQTSTGEVEVELHSDGLTGDLKGSYLTLWEWNDNANGILEDGELVELDCQRYINVTGSQKLSVTASGLSTLSSYYVTVDNNVSPGYAGEFSICVYDQASNDIVEGAYSLMLNTLYNNNGAGHLGDLTTINGSVSKHLPGILGQEKPTCVPSNQYVRNNKWFTFQAVTNDMNIELYTDGLTGDLKGPYLSLWEWSDDGDGILENSELTELDCENYAFITGFQMLTLNASSLTLGNDYLVSVDNNVSPGYAGEFSLQVLSSSSKTDESQEPIAYEDVETMQRNNLIVYPNPSAGIFNFDFSLVDKSSIKIQLFNIEGRMVEKILLSTEYDKGEHVVKFDGKHLNEGVYFYRLYIDDEVFNGKLLKFE